MIRSASMARPGRPAHDLTGQQFGRLTVVRMAPADGGNSRAACKCECGRTTIVRSHHLIRGTTRSCGCLRAEQAPKNAALRLRGSPVPNAAAVMRDARMRGTLSARGRKASRIESAFAAFRHNPSDTIHVDRPGARLVRGGRY